MICRKFLIAAAAIFALGVAYAQQPWSPQCLSGRCPAQPIASTAVVHIEWRRRDDAPDEAYLFVDGRQVGGVNRRRNVWRSYDALTGKWAAEEIALWPDLIAPVTATVPE